MLKLSNVNVYYDAIHALKDVSMEVTKGNIVCLIGGNGAGKSTTLKAISGMVKTKKGSIKLNSLEINPLNPSDIARFGIAHVPEGRRVFNKMTVMENLEMGAFIRSDKKEIKEDYKKMFQLFPRLEERKSQLAGTLSGGEQQMLAIARGLMLRPKLLLLDEPSMGLAPIIVQEIFSIIKDINKAGTTVLLVEQNANLALQTAHEAYVIRNGRIEIKGQAKDILKDERVKKAYLEG